ncbi:hypothetical protein ACFL0U_01645 [Pseudomonadota bacterium]
MKKILFLFLLSFCISINSYSYSLDDAIKDATKNGKSSEVVENIGKNTSDQAVKMTEEKVDKLLVELKQKAEGEIEKYENVANKEIEKVQNKVDNYIAEVDKVVEDAKEGLSFIEDIRANAMKYLKIAGIIVSVLSGGILVVVFFLWKIWKTVKSVAGLNFAFDHKKYENRLKDLEKEVIELKKIIAKE